MADAITAGADSTTEVASIELSLADAPTEMGVHGKWTATVTSSSAADPVRRAGSTGPISLVRDGVVVAVQNVVQVASSSGSRSGRASYAVAPLPMASDESIALAWCDQFLHRDGSAAVEPGTCDLVFSQLGLRRDVARSRPDGASPSPR